MSNRSVRALPRVFPRTRLAAAAAAWLSVAACAGCGGSSSEANSLNDANNVRIWATTSSAVGVYALAYGPIAFADGRGNYEPGCPATTDDGTSVTIQGGCADPKGTSWVGSATVVRSANGGRDLTMTGFGSASSSTSPPRVTGTVRLQSLGASRTTFTADLLDEGGMTTQIAYSGTVSGGYGVRSTWNGSGHVVRTGALPPTGEVDATTVDEVVDDATCSGQPASGMTTIRHGSETAVVTYDGATDCDSKQNARWSLDGKDQGLIDGIACNVSGGVGRRAGGGAVLALGVLVALGACARRAGSVRSSQRT